MADRAVAVGFVRQLFLVARQTQQSTRAEGRHHGIHVTSRAAAAGVHGPRRVGVAGYILVALGAVCIGSMVVFVAGRAFLLDRDIGRAAVT